MDLFTNVPTIVLTVTLEIAGLIAIWGLFDAKLKARTKEKDELEQRIATLYKTEIEALNTKLDNQAGDIAEMKLTVTRLSGENKLMRELLTGQDKDTKDWRNRTEQAMVLIQEVAKLSALNGKKSEKAIEGIEKVGQIVERLALSIEKHLK